MAESPRRRPDLSDEELLVDARRLREAGQFGEALERVGELQGRLRQARLRADAPQWGELLALSSILHRHLGNMERAAGLAQTLLEDARRHGWPRLQAEGLLSLAHCARRQGEVARARAMASEALRALRERRAPEREARALVLLAELSEMRGESEEAETTLREAIEIFHRIGADHRLPTALTTLAGVYRRQGRIEEAGVTLTEAVDIARRLHLDFHLATSLYSLGLFYHHGGEPARGRPYMRRARSLYARLNYHRGEAHALIGLGEIERALGALELAESLYRQVVDAPSPPDLRVVRVGQVNLALVALRRRDWAGARRWLEEGMGALRGELRTTALAVLLAATEGAGDIAAWRDVERAFRASRDAHDPVELDIARALELAGQLALEAGEDPQTMSRAARGFSGALEQYGRLQRLADRTRCATQLRELGERGAPIPQGPFDLIDVLGQGGMGEVWRGTHRDEGVPVAIKVLTSHAARSRRGREALRDEVRAVAALSHAHIVPIFDHGHFGEAASEMTLGRLRADNPCIAIELVEGGSLAPHCGRLPWVECRQVLLELLDALAHAHARGLVHRDIKPDNLLIERRDADGIVIRLSDFGLAQAMGEASHTGIVGTPGYMAPEQFTGAWRQLGPWTDLYAVGCLGWALVTGAPPFAHASVAELRDAHLSQPPPTLQLAVAAPEALESWLRRLLQKAPSQRFQRAADAAWALRQLPDQVSRLSLPTLGQPARHARSSSTFFFDLEPVSLPPRLAVTATLRPIDLPPVPELWEEELPLRPRLSGVGRNLVQLRDAPLVGRSRERRLMWSALRSQAPRVVLLQGEAGVGRTRLAEALLRFAHASGAAVTLRGADGGSSAAAEAISRHHRWTGLSTPALLSEARAWLSEVGADALAHQVAELIRPGAGAASVSGSGARASVVLEALTHVAATRPVAMLLDDVHDDHEALALAELLLDDPRRPPVLLMLTVRDDELAARPERVAAFDALGERPEAIVLRLSPLSLDELRALLQGLLKLDPALATDVARRSAGNPSVAVELVTSWIDEDMLIAGERGFMARRPGALPLPDAVHQRWSRRVDSLLEGRPAHVRRALELAALLGDAPDPIEWLGACAAARLTPPPDLEGTLVEAGLASLTELGWRFVHPLLRESLLRSAEASGEQEALHLACARMLAVHGGAVSRRAFHLYAGGALAEALPLLLSACGDSRDGELVRCTQDALTRLGIPEDDIRWRQVEKAVERGASLKTAVPQTSTISSSMS